MSQHSRFAVYHLPPAGDLADFGARWLGWDVQRGVSVPQLTMPPDLPAHLPPLAEITEAPRKYGFHATLKPPFRLAEGSTEQGLRTALADLAARTAPSLTPTQTLTLTRLGRWFALTVAGDTSGIDRVAAACVTELDAFRAPLTQAEMARRTPDRLTPAQQAHLMRWGYPHVLDQFRFHMTLTGKLAAPHLDAVETLLRAVLPDLPQPFALTDICLCGERADGRFDLLHRYPLTG